MDKVQQETAELIKSVATKAGISEEQAKAAVDTVLEYVKKSGLPGVDTLSEYAGVAKDTLSNVASSVGNFFKSAFGGGGKEEPKKETEEKKAE
ncbi:MAG: hypothetical protein NZ551_03705 [Microscillaceae bacterium]|nr:hypothetical protein [Microscillaceae bacterium]MDW8460294.1 hypothetical protein [Cytophagales bacterium]